MRTVPTDIVTAMWGMLHTFRDRCQDTSTINELIDLTGDRTRWPKAHQLFQKIRAKTLQAERDKNQTALAQYTSEEICTKTLYNLSMSSAPFDPDSAFWVCPLAIELGRHLGITDPTEISPLLSLQPSGKGVA